MVEILEPSSPMPAIKPCAPKGTAKTSCDKVVLDRLEATDLSQATRLGPLPNAQPSLFSRSVSYTHLTLPTKRIV